MAFAAQRTIANPLKVLPNSLRVDKIKQSLGLIMMDRREQNA
ncbi:hypothetical protein [Nostoc sp. MG11]|nr:hypothetical protein [Nostoc sp. MG11]